MENVEFIESVAQHVSLSREFDSHILFTTTNIYSPEGRFDRNPNILPGLVKSGLNNV
jgi:hypothetical protein